MGKYRDFTEEANYDAKKHKQYKALTIFFAVLNIVSITFLFIFFNNFISAADKENKCMKELYRYDVNERRLKLQLEKCTKRYIAMEDGFQEYCPHKDFSVLSSLIVI
jgi:hypothetical protein